MAQQISQTQCQDDDLKSKEKSDRRYAGKKITLDGHGPVEIGFWVPNRVWACTKYLVPLRKFIKKKRELGQIQLIPVMVDFKAWVSDNPVYRMWVKKMIRESNIYVCSQPQEVRDQIKMDGDVVWIGGYDEFFEIINEIITTSPGFNDTEMVGTPLNGFLAVSMATEAGTALFHDTTFNEQFKTVLDSWNSFLKSSDSLDKLNRAKPLTQGSWISPKAFEAGVWEDMEYDPEDPHFGFKSWNDFFIRQFKPDARPFKGNPATQVCIGCETTPWRYANDIKLETRFWIKDMPYSLTDIFAEHTEWAEKFEGGQLYQGFLSATHYHRWQAPLDGPILRSWVTPGTYFAQRPDQGEQEGTWEGTESQPYLGHVAARAVFVFDHPTCGLVALVCIGMVEVSTCYIEPKFRVEGDKPVVAKRGDDIGHFEFGGSTHLMIFQKGKVTLEPWATKIDDTQVVHLGTVIATATK